MPLPGMLYTEIVAKDLGLSTTAEGVKPQRQRAWLVDRGFRLGQNFLFCARYAL